MSDMLMETYLRQQVDKGEYGVVIIPAQIALAIANYIEKHRQPTIEPERKKGKWIKNDNGTYSCGICQSWIPEEQHCYARYCLYCGSEMRGGRK